MGWAVAGKGYLGFGLEAGNSWPSDFYQYDPTNNTWTQKANFPLTGRSYGIAFASCNSKYYYAGTGQNNGNAMQDIWKYDPSLDTWTQETNFGGGNRWIMASFVIGQNGYCGTGYDFTNYYNDWWEYLCNEDGIWEQSEIQNNTSLNPTIFSSFATLEIKSEVNVSNAELNISDMSGKIIRKEKITANFYKLNKGGLPQGIYFYFVINKGIKIGFGKFIIN
jgi:hypothetical protein